MARRLIVLMGLPGAGKSTLARALCRRAGWSRVDRDAFKNRTALFSAKKKNRSVLFSGAAGKEAANAAVWLAAATLLARGRSVVLDGMTFARAAQRRQARTAARRAGATCIEVLVDCPVALAQERVRDSRNHPAGDRSPVLVTRVARRFDPVPARALRLDARQAPAQLLRRLERRLAR